MQKSTASLVYSLFVHFYVAKDNILYVKQLATENNNTEQTAILDENAGEEISITVIATGFDSKSGIVFTKPEEPAQPTFGMNKGTTLFDQLKAEREQSGSSYESNNSENDDKDGFNIPSFLRR